MVNKYNSDREKLPTPIGTSFLFDNIFISSEFKLPMGELIQVSEVAVIDSGEIMEHIQMCDEITYAISGKAKIYSGENCTEIQSGQIHFIKRGLKHRIVADDNERFRYICIGILPDYSYRDIKSFAELLDDDFFFAEDDGDVRILAELLINEFYLRDTESDIMINMYLTQIFISLARILKNGGRTISRNNIYRQNTSQHTIYNTLRYIDREYINIKSVKQIAEHLSYSEYYLSHLFKEKMGISIKEYLTRKKITTAAEMLKTSNIGIEELSEYLNFTTAHTFSQAFRKMLFMSPTEYKKKYNNKF